MENPDRSGSPDPAKATARQALRQLQEQLRKSERLLDLAEEQQPSQTLTRIVHSRWPVAAAVVVAVALQLCLPNSFTPGHRLVPGLELVLLGGLVVADPRGRARPTRWLRRMMVLLTAMITVTNGWSAIRLVIDIAQGKQEDAFILLISGAAIWATNVIVFSLWYWQLDRGGPLGSRAAVCHRDFVFPQQADLDPTLVEWTPSFADYLYLAYTNATSFSPTDVMPYTIRAKMIMMVQSAVSLLTIALVIARAIGLFK
ncbi:hypothetical protein ACFWF7_36615 [Nocardia sp. NPDC060256]|uniref:hypothetical protein n=1 Tax=unclassified Nocardia TaxID=2637762 RepID=UPI00364B1FC6